MFCSICSLSYMEHVETYFVRNFSLFDPRATHLQKVVRPMFMRKTWLPVHLCLSTLTGAIGPALLMHCSI